MAQNMGFGSALTGFGTGYLNALRQGRSEQNSLISAKLRKDALDQKKQDSAAAAALRALQVEDLIDARKDRREAAKERAQNATNKLLFGANAKVADFYTKMQPVIATMDPAQRKTTHDSMRTSVRGMLVAGGMKPEDADSYAESLIKPYGMQLQDEMVDVPVGPDMSKEGLLTSGAVSPSSLMQTYGSQAPEVGKSTDWQLGDDGTYTRAGQFAIDPSLRNYMGMQHVLSSDPVGLAFNAVQGGRNPTEGFSQFAPSTYGAVEQRRAETKQMPASATYGINAKDKSIIARNNAATGLTNVKTQQLIDLYPDQAALLKKKVEALGAGIENTKTKTAYIGLNYDLELRKHAAREAYQRAMVAIGQGNLTNAQRNTALREVGMRIKSIIDPTRIQANAGAIIADLTNAMSKPGADKAGLQKQIARMKSIQEGMMEFSKLATQPTQAITDANYLGNMLADSIGSTPLGQVMGISSNPADVRMQLLGGLPPQNPWEDPFAMSDEDYEDNDFFYGTSPLSQPASAWMNMNLRGGASPRGASRGVRLNLGP